MQSSDSKGKAPADGTGSEARIAELEAQLANLNTQFTDYRTRASEALEKRWAERDAPRSDQFVNAEEAEDAKYEAGYFDSYSFNEIHQIMLQDAVRTDAYRDFIYDNKHLFADKVVLDVGCGTGILSLFAVKAGARKVISVDNSAVIQKAKQIAAVNGVSNRIFFVQGKVEDIEFLPDGLESVDVIVSEWMGYCLLYEAMLDSVLHARDRFLKRNADGSFAGIMAPSHCSIHIAPLADPDWMADNVSFWRGVYGFDMQTMLDGSFEDVVIRHPTNKDVVCADEPSRKPVKVLDLYQVSVADLEFTAPFEVKLDKDIDALDGFCTWFDCLFSPSAPAASVADAQVFEKLTKQSGAVVLSTSPYTKRTHWQCGNCVIDRETGTCSRPRKADEDEEGVAVPLKQGEVLTGSLQMTKAKEKRALDVALQWRTKDGKEQGKQKWKMR